MATFGILCLFTFGIAVIQSVEHSRLIRSGGMTAKVKAEWTAARLLLVGFLCALATVTGLAPWWCAVAFMAGAQGMFSFLFRRRLNAAQGWDRNYLGSTSVYDRTMIALRTFMEEGVWYDAAVLQVVHQGSYVNSPPYRKLVHRAGRTASVIELGAAVMAAVAFVVAALA